MSGPPPSRGAVLVTAGPSIEPIDEVRRITNSSTGQLGVMLANRLAEEEWPVFLLLGRGAIFRGPLHPGVTRVGFSTNEELLQRFQEFAAKRSVAAIFQAAALCDFRVREVVGPAAGQAKISSRAGEITLILEPALKILGTLRNLFPQSRLVGWKYELEGAPEEALAKGRKQLAENGTDLCIVNGRAYGTGFGALDRSGRLTDLPDKPALCRWLTQWLVCGN